MVLFNPSKRAYIELMKTLLFFTVAATLSFTSFAQAAFNCSASESGSKSVTQLTSTTDEPYMADGALRGYKISTYHNEGGDSYSVTVTKRNRLVVSTTIPFYEDATLQFARSNRIITVQCKK